MFSLFSDIFGGKPDLSTEVADLRARVRDLERAALGRPASVDRVHARARLPDLDLASFRLAWRQDLEFALTAGLLSLEGGRESAATARAGVRLAEAGDLDHALIMLTRARGVGSPDVMVRTRLAAYWSRSAVACETLLGEFDAPRSINPIDDEGFAALFDDYDVGIPVGLGGLTEAQSALDWLTSWFSMCDSSLVFDGMVPRSVLEQARAGEWSSILDDHGPTRMVSDVVKYVDWSRECDAAATEWEANLPRVVKAIWWGADETPAGWSRQETDGRWFLMSLPEKSFFAKQEKPAAPHKHLHPDGHAGFESEAGLMRAAWLYQIHGSVLA